MTNPEVDAYVRRADAWQAETERLRAILLDFDLAEELKWRQPCYTFDGRNVAIIQGFKGHCSLMFFKGALLDDRHGVLVPPGENSRAAMRVECASVSQIDELEPAIRDYVEQAIDLERTGAKVDLDIRHEPNLPEELATKLTEDPALAAAFDALTPGRKRGYVLYVSGAKRSKTRTARVERSVERILAGKGWNER